MCITNISSRDIEVGTRNILVRCERCFEDKSSYGCTKNVFSVHVTDREPFNQNELIYNKNLTHEQVKRLLDLISSFRCCFAKHTGGLGKTDVLKMSIHLTDDKPVIYRPYRLAHSEREDVKKIVDDL